MQIAGRMNYIKTDPTGIDKPIQRLQTALYNKLENISTGYGRIYKVPRDGKKEVPAYFMNETTDYKEVLTDDRLKGSFFFVEYYRTKTVNGMYETPVDIIFMLNLKEMKPGVPHRADEEIKSDIMAIVERHKYYRVTDIVKGRNALTGFHHRLQDMQPYSYIKLTGIMRYQLNC